jgi:GNAT superfamily N-acetyltransferase
VSGTPKIAAGAYRTLVFMQSLEMKVVTYDHPDSQMLIDEVQLEYVERYGGPDETQIEPSEFSEPHGLFIVGYLDGVPMSTGAWRRPDVAHLGPNWAGHDHEREPLAEIKRMFVRKPNRGHGYSRAMLAELERTARERGITHFILETGTMQPEAISLYTSSGYEPVPGFGRYCAHELARHFGKRLAPGGAQ